MRIRKIFVSAAFVLISLSVAAAEQPDKWNITKSTHFIVYYKKAPEDFIGKLIDRAEGYYSKIADELGFRRFDFWLWDNRAKIYIHDDAQAYQSATAQPAWSGGCAFVRQKLIHTYPNAQGFFETIMAHEMGHIIFREFVGFDNYAVPLWLEEGVASYQQKLKYSMVNSALKDAIEKKSFMPLENLSVFNPQGSDDDSVKIFYFEAFGVVDFLMKGFGRDRFVLFCQNLRDKKDLARAIASSYPFSDISALEKAWLKFIKR